MMVLRDSAGVIYPADRCTWTQTQVGGTGGYVIATATFYPGNAVGSAITDPELGFIGKSGRFVKVAG